MQIFLFLAIVCPMSIIKSCIFSQGIIIIVQVVSSILLHLSRTELIFALAKLYISTLVLYLFVILLITSCSLKILLPNDLSSSQVSLAMGVPYTHHRNPCKPPVNSSLIVLYMYVTGKSTFLPRMPKYRPECQKKCLQN